MFRKLMEADRFPLAQYLSIGKKNFFEFPILKKIRFKNNKLLKISCGYILLYRIYNIPNLIAISP